jgi:hypothetical protein
VIQDEHQDEHHYEHQDEHQGEHEHKGEQQDEHLDEYQASRVVSMSAYICRISLIDPRSPKNAHCSHSDMSSSAKGLPSNELPKIANFEQCSKADPQAPSAS